MKTLLTISTLVFTVMFSSTSFAGWTKVGTIGGGENTYYVDFERIRKHGGYVYFWRLFDNLKPDKFGNLSVKMYYQGDCKLFRTKTLSGSFFKEPMGKGTPESLPVPKKHKDWSYPPPNSISEAVLESVCNR